MTANDVEGEARRRIAILFVDDDVYFRRLIMPVLESRGYDVVQAATAADATAAVKSRQFHLVIMDGLLPDGDGIRWIADRREAGDRTPVVFVSAFWRDVQSFRKLTHDLDVALVVNKPVVPSVFGVQIENLVATTSLPLLVGREMPPSDAMETLRAEYANTLPERLGELSRALKDVRSDRADSDVIGEARNRAHQLKGTAASFGFDEVGEAAGKIEDALVVLQGSKTAPLPAGKPASWDTIEQALEAAVRAVEQPVSTPPPPRRGIRRLLLVTADATLVRQLQRHAGWRLEVLGATDAQEAKGILRQVTPDAAMIDIADGENEIAYALAGDLRAMPGCEGIPLGFIGSEASVEQRVAALEAGASLHLVKPVGAEAIADAARQLGAMRQTAAPTVLVAHSDDAFLLAMRELLEGSGIRVRTTRDPETILEMLSDERPELLLLDVIVGGRSGFGICRMLRAMPQWQDLPVLFLTAVSSSETRIAAFRAGGDDYLVKPVIADELLARIQVRLDRARLMRERSDKDALTGLLVGPAFLDRVAGRLAEARRHGQAMTLCILDLDDFRTIGNEHGHRAGDAVVAQLGRLLAGRFRVEDVRGRWGPGEFIVAFPNASIDMMRGAVMRFLDEVKRTVMQASGGASFHVALSGGMAAFPTDGEDMEALLHQATSRLARARQQGGAQLLDEDPVAFS